MADLAHRISPLHDLAEPGSFGAAPDAPGVELSERLPTSLIQIQAWPETVAELSKKAKSSLGGNLPEHGAIDTGKSVVMATGPGRWLVESDMDDLEANLRAAVPVSIAAVTGLTHARTIVTISGEKARWVLSSGVPLDFHDEAFPVGDVKLSHHHEIGLTIHRTGEDTYDLYVFTSLVRSFWGWITKSGAEVGYKVI